MYAVKGYAGPATLTAKFGALLLHTTHRSEGSKDAEVASWKARMARGEVSKIEIINLRTHEVETITP